MQTYHIHINGLVQGVGFRPFVCRLAREMNIRGWVSNSTNGVHIEINATESGCREFYARLFKNPPANAIITNHSITKTEPKEFKSFTIETSSGELLPDLLITPDIAICADCKREFLDKHNRRYHYPFTSCLNCGPRYSILTSLPYDREYTTMAALPLCNHCKEEYNDINNERHFCQTNSCPHCAIPMHLFDSGGKVISETHDEIFQLLLKGLREGKIAAVKGIGGYLLVCDATNASVIDTLRKRKHRPSKPFALLYKDIDMVRKDVYISPLEQIALEEKVAPIVLCRVHKNEHHISLHEIAPNLNKIGVMLPCSPLLLLIADRFDKPLIATSANISGSPIIFQDNEAKKYLGDIADMILTFDREIVTPQDDSVIQFTEKGQKIILRRSRGLAPGYYPDPFEKREECILAMGGELKSAFALYNHGNLLVSQFMGDQASYESQRSFLITSSHLQQLFKCMPQKILVDKHPGYFVSQEGRREAAKENIELLEIQHHKAHFAAVLAENNLLSETQPVLGVIWDGAGYGDDHQVWGGEMFLYKDSVMKRVAHLDYFPQVLGDKMNKEPRLSALSLLKKLPGNHSIIQHYFSSKEWYYYNQLLEQEPKLLTSSMGRFLDGIAAILGITGINSYEGEAAMRLEAMAQRCGDIPSSMYPLPFEEGIFKWQPLFSGVVNDYKNKEDVSKIARKVFYSLAAAIAGAAGQFQVEKIACSGGVFQNGLLTDLVIEKIQSTSALYFHRKLSPNDECIGFGQLAYYFMGTQPEEKVRSQTRNVIVTS